MQEQARLRGNNRRAPGGIFKQLMEYRLQPRVEHEVAQCFYESLDTPISLGCALRLKYAEHDQLVTKSIHPNEYLYSDIDSFTRDFLAVSYLSKSKWLKTTFDKEALALAGFKAAEERCRDTNHRFGCFPRKITNLLHETVLAVQARKIERILGRFNISRVLDEGSWGPGATLSIKGEDTSWPAKFDRENECTRDLHALYGPVLEKAYPSWLGGKDFSFKFVRGNEVGTVPKNAKIDRVVAPEPGLNSWVQKGIGRCIRWRLGRAGYDLNSDYRNRMGAFRGSVSGGIATLDLKDASNSLATEYIREQLPPEWFIPMDAARSKFYKTKTGDWTESQMFSTMGNGFTFELESLIFLTLALACCEQLHVDSSEVTIFGDDVVLPVEVVPLFSEMCHVCGFTLNESKSFSSGPFRESCGAYFFGGVDVKPLFRKEQMSTVTSVYRAANSIRQLAYRQHSNQSSVDGCSSLFKKTWNVIVHSLPGHLRLFGAPDAGDGVIHVDLTEMVAVGRHKSLISDPEELSRLGIIDNFEPQWIEDQWEGYVFPALVTVPIDVEYDSHGLLLARLRQSSSRATVSYGNSVSLRQTTRLFLNKRAFVQRWCNIGPWC